MCCQSEHSVDTGLARHDATSQSMLYTFVACSSHTSVPSLLNDPQKTSYIYHSMYSVSSSRSIHVCG